MRHTIPLLLSFLFVSPIVSQGQENPLDLSGEYSVVSPDGGYTGTVLIRKDGQVYNLLWRLKPDGVHQGVGVLTGRTLSANWGIPVAVPLPVGTVVEARWKNGLAWFPGKIQKINPDGTYAVRYDDGDFEASVKRELIIPKGELKQAPRIANVGLGVVVYQVGPNGRVLAGLFAQFGSNRVFRENLTRTK